MDALRNIFTDANSLFPILNHWLHLMSAVIWIGGLAFVVLVVTPSLHRGVPREFVKPIADVLYRHYKKVIGIVLVVILFTGGLNLHFINKMMVSQLGELGGVAHNAKYLTIFFIKLSLVLTVLTLFLYTVVFKTDETGDEDAAEKQEQFEEPVPFQRLNLILGAFIILCAAALKYLHF
ncbi:hypothetical protein YTPLAS18_05610 [Nitrospira sp.]|nr:hypothetical protein YTPLAS18_05610 [Nitrospira sp.]